ncbi:MAG: serine/threonine protein kinase, partial [Myxococcales bacterium]|nr:serine/threonine protein kinase [Myxococcales bacterium]
MTQNPYMPEALEPEESLTGRVLDGRYRVYELLGKGGMGAVYRAEHVELGRVCAVKVLLPRYTSNENAVRRFRREARASSRVNHENVVEIYDTGQTADGLGYIAMEYLRGENLADTLERERRLPWARLRPIMLQLCAALAAAHAEGVVHRDMKPENCLRIRRGGRDFIKVLDFGIAK